MMKTEVVRQSIGIDCAKDEFVAAFCCSKELRGSDCKQTRAFKNSKQGFARFMAWQRKLREEEIALPMVMEATGVYHEQLACALVEGGCQVHVVLPNKAKAFARSINLRSVDDGSSARTLALMGMERQLDAWEKPQEVYIRMKHLTREREGIQQALASTKNQLHAEEAGAFGNPSTIKRLKGRIGFLERQIKEVETDLRALIKAESELEERIERVCTAPGIGWLTMAILLAETNGFHMVRNQRQLTKYAGLDVEKHDSGTSVHKPGRLSKKGNRHIRKALYMPALSRIRVEASSKEFFTRLVSKHGVRKKAVAAVQRKTLVLAYTLWKNNAPYDLKHRRATTDQKKGQPLEAALTS